MFVVEGRVLGKKSEAAVSGVEMVQNVILVFFRRRLSQRPAVEELESRNILKRKFHSFSGSDLPSYCIHQNVIPSLRFGTVLIVCT